jgi:hypothetical protein
VEQVSGGCAEEPCAVAIAVERGSKDAGEDLSDRGALNPDVEACADDLRCS